MKITVSIDIPPGDTCYYPAKQGETGGFSCPWKITHVGAKKKWCRIFGNADVSLGDKCADCLRFTRADAEQALKGLEQ